MFEKITATIKEKGAVLVAVSKTQSPGSVIKIYNKGHRVFGENKVQELVQKYKELPKDINWHFIGHLQRNKVKYIAPFVKSIDSVDSFKLLKEINKQAGKHERKIDCMLQIKIAREETKYGMSFDDAAALLNNPDFEKLENVRITGLMGMATFSDDSDLVRSEFKKLKQFFDHLKSTFFAAKPYFKDISMGMSGDYDIALEEGSTMVRIGTLVFGPRS